MHSEFECFDLLSKYLKRNKGMKFWNAMFLKYLSSSFTVFLKFHKGINEALTEASNIVILLEFQGIYQAPTYQELNYPVNVRWGERRRSHITLQWTSSSATPPQQRRSMADTRFEAPKRRKPQIVTLAVVTSEVGSCNVTLPSLSLFLTKSYSC